MYPKKVRFLELDKFFPGRLFFMKLFLVTFCIQTKLQKNSFLTLYVILWTTRLHPVKSFEKKFKNFKKKTFTMHKIVSLCKKSKKKKLQLCCSY